MLRLTAAGRSLIWHAWDDHYAVYQPSSAETHFFNRTTVLILDCLRQGRLSAEATREQVQRTLEAGEGELTMDDIAFALGRLEELGLIERFDETNPVPCSSVT